MYLGCESHHFVAGFGVAYSPTRRELRMDITHQTDGRRDASPVTREIAVSLDGVDLAALAGQLESAAARIRQAIAPQPAEEVSSPFVAGLVRIAAESQREREARRTA